MSFQENAEWQDITPRVNSEAEFFEILSDFDNPLEVLREAISNSIDALASQMWISMDVKEIEGVTRLVITIKDNGKGMTADILARDFWGLGYSPSRDRVDAIGEKGHGTKIFLRAERVIVRTQTEEGSYQSICERPLAQLSQRKLHKPQMRAIDDFMEHTGTEIEIIGYNNDERMSFIQDIVKDYILWFTKIGSIELQFGITKYQDFKLYLKAINVPAYEEISFGHLFPPENPDLSQCSKDDQQ